MYLLDYVSPEAATGKVKELYDVFPAERGVPEPLQKQSVSPELMQRQFEIIKYYSGHPTLSFPLLASIRYVLARKNNYSCCVDFNGNSLKACGMGPGDLEALHNGEAGTPLEEREEAMLNFVVTALETPEQITAESTKAMRDMGWNDRDMFDAVAHGTSIAAAAKLDMVFTD